MDSHRCSVCGETKSFTAFYVSYARSGWEAPDGRRRRYCCKDCFNAAAKIRRANPSIAYKKGMMLSAARKRAMDRNIPFNLTLNDFTIPSHCPVLGLPLHPSPYGTNHPVDNSPTLDRIVNEKGYVPDNIVVVSWLANRIKNTATPAMLRRVAEFYENLEQQRQKQSGISENPVVYRVRVAGRV